MESQDQVNLCELFVTLIMQRSGTQRPLGNAQLSHWLDSIWEHGSYVRELGSVVKVIFPFLHYLPSVVELIHWQ
jgi:hypothetical protein